ncbi:unnamed protein product [Amoebophrya sp. A120]|nr:unnamed protein product [Amoebophrya sp. A120]|eukprot:GSA120T00008541001.1
MTNSTSSLHQLTPQFNIQDFLPRALCSVLCRKVVFLKTKETSTKTGKMRALPPARVVGNTSGQEQNKLHQREISNSQKRHGGQISTDEDAIFPDDAPPSDFLEQEEEMTRSMFITQADFLRRINAWWVNFFGPALFKFEPEEERHHAAGGGGSKYAGAWHLLHHPGPIFDQQREARLERRLREVVLGRLHDVAGTSAGTNMGIEGAAPALGDAPVLDPVLLVGRWGGEGDDTLNAETLFLDVFSRPQLSAGKKTRGGQLQTGMRTSATLLASRDHIDVTSQVHERCGFISAPARRRTSSSSSAPALDVHAVAARIRANIAKKRGFGVEADFPTEHLHYALEYTKKYHTEAHSVEDRLALLNSVLALLVTDDERDDEEKGGEVLTEGGLFNESSSARRRRSLDTYARKLPNKEPFKQADQRSSSSSSRGADYPAAHDLFHSPFRLRDLLETLEKRFLLELQIGCEDLLEEVVAFYCLQFVRVELHVLAVLEKWLAHDDDDEKKSQINAGRYGHDTTETISSTTNSSSEKMDPGEDINSPSFGTTTTPIAWYALQILRVWLFLLDFQSCIADVEVPLQEVDAAGHSSLFSNINPEEEKNSQREDDTSEQTQLRQLSYNFPKELHASKTIPNPHDYVQSGPSRWFRAIVTWGLGRLSSVMSEHLKKYLLKRLEGGVSGNKNATSHESGASRTTASSSASFSSLPSNKNPHHLKMPAIFQNGSQLDWKLSQKIIGEKLFLLESSSTSNHVSATSTSQDGQRLLVGEGGVEDTKPSKNDASAKNARSAKAAAGTPLLFYNDKQSAEGEGVLEDDDDFDEDIRLPNPKTPGSYQSYFDVMKQEGKGEDGEGRIDRGLELRSRVEKKFLLDLHHDDDPRGVEDDSRNNRFGGAGVVSPTSSSAAKSRGFVDGVVVAGGGAARATRRSGAPGKNGGTSFLLTQADLLGLREDAGRGAELMFGDVAKSTTSSRTSTEQLQVHHRHKKSSLVEAAIKPTPTTARTPAGGKSKSRGAEPAVADAKNTDVVLDQSHEQRSTREVVINKRTTSPLLWMNDKNLFAKSAGVPHHAEDPATKTSSGRPDRDRAVVTLKTTRGHHIRATEDLYSEQTAIAGPRLRAGQAPGDLSGDARVIDSFQAEKNMDSGVFALDREPHEKALEDYVMIPGRHFGKGVPNAIGNKTQALFKDLNFDSQTSKLGVNREDLSHDIRRLLEPHPAESLAQVIGNTTRKDKEHFLRAGSPFSSSAISEMVTIDQQGPAQQDDSASPSRTASLFGDMTNIGKTATLLKAKQKLTQEKRKHLLFLPLRLLPEGFLRGIFGAEGKIFLDHLDLEMDEAGELTTPSISRHNIHAKRVFEDMYFATPVPRITGFLEDFAHLAVEMVEGDTSDSLVVHLHEPALEQHDQHLHQINSTTNYSTKANSASTTSLSRIRPTKFLNQARRFRKQHLQPDILRNVLLTDKIVPRTTAGGGGAPAPRGRIGAAAASTSVLNNSAQHQVPKPKASSSFRPGHWLEQKPPKTFPGPVPGMNEEKFAFSRLQVKLLAHAAKLSGDKAASGYKAAAEELMEKYFAAHGWHTRLARVEV